MSGHESNLHVRAESALVTPPNLRWPMSVSEIIYQLRAVKLHMQARCLCATLDRNIGKSYSPIHEA